MANPHAFTPARRRCLARLAALGGSVGAGAWAQRVSAQAVPGGQADGQSGWHYLCARRRLGRDEAVLIDAAGRDRRVIALPARGHGFALDAVHRRAVVFGRQAGFYALAFDLDRDAPPQRIVPAAGRHFYGHGVYVDEGCTLVATENDYTAGRGVLGLYDARDHYRRVGEYDTGGIGPHEVIALPGERTLCVANGGMLTHPDYGKLALNLADMAPSLAYLDAGSGALLEERHLPPELHRLSIRHLALDASSAVWFGGQYQGAAADRVPLVGRHRRGHALELFSAPAEIQRGLRHYIGSVCANATGSLIATSSPVGGLIAYWDAARGHCLGSTTLFDACGLAPSAANGFLLTSGAGPLRYAGPELPTQPLPAVTPEVAWDNHARVVSRAS